MEPIVREFEFLTPAFVHGAYQSQHNGVPELRGPSIRGQLRWWFAALHGQEPDGKASRSENAIFGHVVNRRLGLDGNLASLFALRVHQLRFPGTGKAPLLPHKEPNRRGEKNAFFPGSIFEVTLQEKREGLSEEQRKQLTRALDSWLLLGGIGQRSNRAAGSPWPCAAPQDAESYGRCCQNLLDGSPIRFALLNASFEIGDRKDSLRTVAGNILADEAFAECGRPFGSARPRKPSSLKLRAVRFGNALHLVATWDSRDRSADLSRAVEIMRDKPLGKLLASVLPRLI